MAVGCKCVAEWRTAQTIVQSLQNAELSLAACLLRIPVLFFFLFFFTNEDIIFVY